MPVVQKLMDALVDRYGQGKGQTVYYSMEAQGTGPFGPKGKHHAEHLAFAERNAVRPVEDRGTKRARRPKARRARKGHR